MGCFRFSVKLEFGLKQFLLLSFAALEKRQEWLTQLPRLLCFNEKKVTVNTVEPHQTSGTKEGGKGTANEKGQCHPAFPPTNVRGEWKWRKLI